MEWKESRRRLLVLADKLDTVEEERFDYSKWVGTDWEGDPGLSCGTKACALGWATTIPEFQEKGLKLNPDTRDVNFSDMDRFASNIRAGAYFFGISMRDSTDLFANADWLSVDNISPKFVAQQIRVFVEKKDKELNYMEEKATTGMDLITAFNAAVQASVDKAVKTAIEGLNIKQLVEEAVAKTDFGTFDEEKVRRLARSEAERVLKQDKEETDYEDLIHSNMDYNRVTSNVMSDLDFDRIADEVKDRLDADDIAEKVKQSIREALE